MGEGCFFWVPSQDGNPGRKRARDGGCVRVKVGGGERAIVWGQEQKSKHKTIERKSERERTSARLKNNV